MNELIATASSVAAAGQAILQVELVHGQSTVTSARATAPLKILTPVSRGLSAWACLSNFGGGLVAGDQTRLDLQLGAGARCFLGTQSSTKVYRNPAGHPCSHHTNAVLAPGSVLVFAPDPLQAFAGSRYRQHQEFRLAASSGLVLLDWFSSGRAARGERWQFSHLESRNDVFIEDKPAVVDPIRLSSAETGARMGRFNCLATLLLLGPPLKTAAAALLTQMAARPVEKRAALVLSASPVSGGVLLRVAGEDVETVRRTLHTQLPFLGELLGDDPWIRKW